MARLTFYGAAQEVTGSCYLLESPDMGRILLECGMHQGGDAVDRIRREKFSFCPQEIDAVILSHAHLDHCGLLPKLVHEGFDGPIYCTLATADLLEIMLNDSVGLYERDLDRENRRRERSGRELLKAEYSKADVNKTLKHCSPLPYKESKIINDSLSLCFHDAGHILGSSIVELNIHEKNETKTLVFSGDLGKKNSVLMNDPAVLQKADFVMMESTYGDREHRTIDDTLVQLENILNDTWKKGGNVLIPAFAVGRTQEIIFQLGCLYHQGRLNNWQVFLDSPMAIRVTKVYDRWLSDMADDDVKYLNDNDRESLEKFLPTLHLTATPEESMAINRISRGAIIIAGSGMCTGGRIRHHFKERIWNESNTVIFAGFQAAGTLGRLLVDGLKRITIFNEDFIVKANIETLGGFSAHAGQSGLIEWLLNFGTEHRTFLIHGEPKALEALSWKLWAEHGMHVSVPAQGSSVVL